MAKRIELVCTHEDFHNLHVLTDASLRKKKDVVRVPKLALAALLRDHSALIRLHNETVGGIL